MRAVLIGILALLVGGCAAPAFDLVSRDPESPWLAGNRWVRTESSRATITTSFARTLADHLVFEVEIVNQSDSTLVVDPERFSYTLSSSARDLPARLRRDVAALAPANVVTRLDKEAARLHKEYERGPDQGLLITAVAGAVLIAALALDVVEFGEMGSVSHQETSGGIDISFQDPPPPPWPDPSRLRDRCVVRLLQRVTLAPGETVRGDLWLPAAPVRKAIDPTASAGEMSITALGPPAIPDYGLTLRAPAELGGQEFEYSIAPPCEP
jgi:hypothetical protein